MALCYKKLWKLLIDRDMTRADLREATGVAPATLAKMSRGEAVGAGILERICASMQCNIGDIVDYVPGTPYRLSVNGELSTIDDSVFVLPETQGYTEFSVEIAGKHVNGFMSKPLFSYHLTPQVAFFPKENGDTVSIKVSVAHGGDYLMDIGYRATGTFDVRKIAANGHPMGTLLMASGNQQEVDGLSYSNMVRVMLLKGENVITIRQIRLPKPFTSCEPVNLRIISL